MLMVRIRLRGPGDRQTEFILGLSKGKADQGQSGLLGNRVQKV